MEVRQPHAGRFIGAVLLGGLYNAETKTGGDQTITAGAGATAITNLLPAVTIDPLDRGGLIMVASINYSGLATGECDFNILVGATITPSVHVGAISAGSANTEYTAVVVGYWTANQVGAGAVTWAVQATATVANMTVHENGTRVLYAFVSENA